MKAYRKSAVAMMLVAGGLAAAVSATTVPAYAQSDEGTIAEVTPCIKTRENEVTPCIKTRDVTPCIMPRGDVTPCIKPR